MAIIAIMLLPQFSQAAPAAIWQNLSPTTAIKDVAYGNGQYVAVGQGFLMASTDGTRWERMPLPGGMTSLDQIVFGSGRFVGVTSWGIVASTDGRTWTSQSPRIFHNLIYENGLFVAAGRDGIYTSPDGLTWTPGITTKSSLGIAGVAFGNGRFVAIGDKATYTSEDGVTWNEHPRGKPLLFGVAFGNGRFVAVQGTSRVSVSTDGVVWREVGTPFYVGSLVFGNGVFLSVSPGAPDSTTITSPDGETWTEVGKVRDKGFFNLTGFVNGRFVARLSYGLVTSTDGKEWEHFAGWTHGEDLAAVTYGNGRWVAVGERGLILTSPDGQIWTKRASGVENDLVAVHYARGKFVATGRYLPASCGDSNCVTFILTSDDGTVWTNEEVDDYSLNGIAYGNDRWVVLD